MRMIYRLRLNDSSNVHIIAPTSKPTIGARSFVLPVGIIVSKIILLTIGVNIPISTTSNAAITINNRLDPDTTFHMYLIRSLSVSLRKGKGLVNVKAECCNCCSISCLFIFRKAPCLSRYSYPKPFLVGIMAISLPSCVCPNKGPTHSRHHVPLRMIFRIMMPLGRRIPTSSSSGVFRSSSSNS